MEGLTNLIQFIKCELAVLALNIVINFSLHWEMQSLELSCIILL